MTGHAGERRVAWALGAAISTFYWAFTLLASSRKLLWNDELYTYYVARLPSMKSVWEALLAGGEQTPPFFYFVTRLSIAAFGPNATALRLPEMIGFWAMGICIAVFVARRTSPLFGVAAGAFPLVTGAYYYASEARPYGLMLGLGACALLCWQSIAIGRPRWAWVSALALSLAAVVSSHYYGVFLLAAIAFGEAVRSWTLQRLDGAVWGAFAVALAPLALQLPLLRAGASYSGAFWSPPQWVNIPDFYYNLLSPGVVPFAAMTLCLGLLALIVSDPSGRPVPSRPPLHEIAALAALIGMPIACVFAAKLATGAFTNRYAIGAVIGFAAFLPLAARRVAPFPAAALIAVACFWGWFTLSELRELVEPTQAPVTMASVQGAFATIRSARESSLPVAIADPHTFTVLYHYASDDLRPRLAYLADPARALKQLRNNSVERGMVDLVGPWFGMPVVPYSEFVDTHPKFLVYGNFGALAFLNWLVPDIQAGGFRMELLGVQGDCLFLLVTREHTARERANDAP